MGDGRKDDAGQTITITVTDGGVADDISAATTKTIKVLKPDETLSAVTASFTTNGTDGKIYITCNSGLVNQVGTYTVQGYIAGSGFEYHTKQGFLTFDQILE